MALIECPVCGRKLADRARMCSDCGTSMEDIKRIIKEKKNAPKILVCPECGAEVLETEEACPNCLLPIEFIKEEQQSAEPEVTVYLERVKCTVCGSAYAAEEMVCPECGYPARVLCNDLNRIRKGVNSKRVAVCLNELMAECDVSKLEDLALCDEPFDSLEVYTKIMNYGDESIKSELKVYLDCINDRKKKAEFKKSNEYAKESMDKDDTEELFIDVDENCLKKMDKLKKPLLVNKRIGDIIKFGRYDQGNGLEPIEWQVLDKKDNKILIISKYALDCKKYNEKYVDVTWEKCTLRSWLNNEFMSQAFNNEEQAVITDTFCTADRNRKYITNPGNNTKDKVFLLSIKEAEKYFKTKKGLTCVPTEYAKSNGVSTSNIYAAGGKATCWWWLRSPGKHKVYASGGDYDGSVGCLGDAVSCDHNAVRPALWINLDEFYKAVIESEEELKVQDIITFGRYEQGNGLEPIEWQVLDKKDNKILIISKYALDCKKYNDKLVDITWDKCTLKGWLNNEFMNKAFNNEEQAAIIATICTADKNWKYSINPGNNTKDNIFLLSIKEVEKYFKTKKDRICVPTKYAKSNGVWTNSDYTVVGGKATCWWWLRSPGDNQGRATYVFIDGSVRYIGYNVDTDYGAVRPALWINIET